MTASRVAGRNAVRGRADELLLNALQDCFPIDRRPFARLGESLSMSEAAVIARTAALKDAGLVRQLSAIFDTRALGYQSCLVAMRVAPERLDQAAAVVNAHPGVSHNYKRNHAFNLWLTIAVPAEGDLAWTVARLGTLAGAASTRLLPTLRLFKIGVSLDMTGDRPPNARAAPPYGEGRRQEAARHRLTAEDVAVVRILQEDLPLEPEPFLKAAAALNMSQGALLDRLLLLRRRGYLRRIAAILRHREAGFGANAMAVWRVPQDRVVAVGERMASFAAVSHCYQRPTYPDWPYNVFTMIHGRKVGECRAVAEAISRDTGLTDYAMLFSTKEYKKVRLRLFVPELDGWEAQQRALAAQAAQEDGDDRAF